MTCNNLRAPCTTRFFLFQKGALLLTLFFFVVGLFSLFHCNGFVNGNLKTGKFEKKLTTTLKDVYHLHGSQTSIRKADFNSATVRLQAALKNCSTAADTVLQLNSFIFDSLKIRFDSARTDINNIDPYKVLINRKGSCVGISLLYLLLGERLSLPLYGVLVPGHFFVRFDNGKDTINIESLKKGEHRENSWYKDRFLIPHCPFYRLNNLEPRHVIAVVEFNIGTRYLHLNNGHNAELFLKRALKNFKQFPEAWGNLAIAQQLCGSSDSALSSLLMAEQMCFDLPNIDLNIGLLQLQNGQPAKAIEKLLLAHRKGNSSQVVYLALAKASLVLKQPVSDSAWIDSASAIGSLDEKARAFRDQIQLVGRQ